MAPQSGVNGVLPVAVLQKNTPTPAPRGPKAASPRLKLVLRRLPPGLTKSELDAILGEEWKLGAGKVDWMNFKKGKISKEYAFLIVPPFLLHLCSCTLSVKPNHPDQADSVSISQRKPISLRSASMSARQTSMMPPNLFRIPLSSAHQRLNSHLILAFPVAGRGTMLARE